MAGDPGFLQYLKNILDRAIRLGFTGKLVERTKVLQMFSSTLLHFKILHLLFSSVLIADHECPKHEQTSEECPDQE